MISICIRTFFNINIFLPSTDGYFVFSDTINKPNLFDYSNKLFKEFIKSRKTKAKNLPYIFYAVIGYLSIFISWCFFFLPLIIYFYYAFKN
jgi:putative peptide zinc metalloprotease protein